MLKMQQTKELQVHESKRADVKGLDFNRVVLFLIVMGKGGSRFLHMVAKWLSSYGLMYSV